MENLLSKVDIVQRNTEIYDTIAGKCITEIYHTKRDGLDCEYFNGNLTPLKDFIANLVEQAYIAGANRANLSEAQRKPLQESGEILTLARNYVKDKGLRI